MERVERILSAVNDKVQRLFNLDNFYIALCDETSGELTVPLAMEKDSEGQINSVSWPCRAPQAPQLLKHIIEQKQPMHLLKPTPEDFGLDVAQDSQSIELPLAWLAAPMLMEGRVLGIMVVENYHNSQVFGQTGVALLTTVARQTAIAIDNAYKSARLARKMNALKAVNEIGRELNSRIDLDEAGIIELIDQQVSDLMDTRNMYIALYDKETDEVRFPLMRVNGEYQEVPSRRGGQGRTEWIIHNRESVLITTLAESVAWYQKPGRTEYIGQPFASWIGEPMIAGNRVIGVIAAYEDDQEHLYDADDLEVLQAIAGQAATAFENARLYDELRQINLRLQERTEELRHINEQLRVANEELLRTQDVRLLAALGGVTAGLIHKMSNTLGPIPSFWVGQIEPCLDPNSEKAIRALYRIRDNVRDTLKYVEDMNKLLASPKISREEAKLEMILRNTLRQVCTDIIGSAITVKSNLDEVTDIPLVYISPSLIGEVFQNITWNAVQAMPNGGQLVVCLEKIGEETLRITIQDTGEGIPEANQESIFTPGFSTKKEGRGLGLWFSKAVVEQHQGKISFESQEGEGTTFTIILPIQSSPVGMKAS